MNATFPIDCYRSSIADITQSVFETMLGLTVRAIPETQESPDELTGAVYYAGAWKGALLIQCSAAQAADWSGRLMSIEPPVSTDDARDGLGELTNMLAGNLKPLLPPGVGLSLPSVVQGKDYSLRICGKNLFERMLFSDGIAPFLVTLVEVVDPA